MGCCASVEPEKRQLIVGRFISTDKTIEVLALPDRVDVYDKTATDCCVAREIAEMTLEAISGKNSNFACVITPSSILYPDAANGTPLGNPASHPGFDEPGRLQGEGGF